MILRTIRRSSTYRYALILALWAMVLPALLPLVHPQAAVAAAGQPICHMMMAGMAMPAPVQYPNKQPPTKAPAACPICQTIGSLAQGFVAPDIVVIADLQPVTVKLDATHQSFAVFTTHTLAWPRAPPSLA